MLKDDSTIYTIHVVQCIDMTLIREDCLINLFMLNAASHSEISNITIVILTSLTANA